MEIRIPCRKRSEKQSSDESKLGFGKLFTDRMLLVEWKVDQGWIDARIEPYAPFVLDPACLSSIMPRKYLRGLKAYRGRMAPLPCSGRK